MDVFSEFPANDVTFFPKEQNALITFPMIRSNSIKFNRKPQNILVGDTSSVRNFIDFEYILKYFTQMNEKGWILRGMYNETNYPQVVIKEKSNFEQHLLSLLEVLFNSIENEPHRQFTSIERVLKLSTVLQDEILPPSYVPPTFGFMPGFLTKVLPGISPKKVIQNHFDTNKASIEFSYTTKQISIQIHFENNNFSIKMEKSSPVPKFEQTVAGPWSKF